MAAPVGNQFWKLRSKHGRDKLFTSPELLWDAACEYFEHTDARVWTKKDWVGKDAIEVNRETSPPYTVTGLCLYLGCCPNYWRHFRSNAGHDFMAVITQVDLIIYTQKFEGASVGAYNANIIARDLGLADKKEITADVSMDDIDYTKLSDDALREIAAAKRE